MKKLVFIALWGLVACGGYSERELEILHSFETTNFYYNHTIENRNDRKHAAINEILYAEQDSITKITLEEAFMGIAASNRKFGDHVYTLVDNKIDEFGDNNGTANDEDYEEKNGRKQPKKSTATVALSLAELDDLAQKMQETREKYIGGYASMLQYFQDSLHWINTKTRDSLLQDLQHQPQLQTIENALKQPQIFTFWRYLLAMLRGEADIFYEYLLDNLWAIRNEKMNLQHNFFPVVDIDKTRLRLGEVLEANIQAASMSYNDKLAYKFEMLVNGKAYTIAKTGKVLVEIPATKLGKQTMRIDLAVRNRLTGKTLNGTSIFNYQVSEKCK